MTSAATPLVSICIPTYKGAAFVGATIESVLAQSYPNFELWIFDDQSPDETKTIVARYADTRMRYLRNEANLGPEGNWNKCLELAHGKYFKLLPHDDLLTPDCLREQVAVLESDSAKRIALVFGYREIINSNGRTLMRCGLPGARAGLVGAAELARRCVRAGTNLIGEPGNGLFRSELIREVGVYDASFPYLVDLDYWFRVLMHGDGYYTASHSSSFRLSPGSWSVAIGNKQIEDFQGLVQRFAAEPRFGITSTDKLIGFARSRLNTWARTMIYRLMS